MLRCWVLCVAVAVGLAPHAARAARPAEHAAVRSRAPAPVAPPPLAPLDGHEHRHRSGAWLRYDAGLGAWVVLGATAHYFAHGSFLRLHAGSWQSSRSVEGPWRALRHESVPLALRAKHYAQEH